MRFQDSFIKIYFSYSCNWSYSFSRYTYNLDSRLTQNTILQQTPILLAKEGGGSSAWLKSEWKLQTAKLFLLFHQRFWTFIKNGEKKKHPRAISEWNIERYKLVDGCRVAHCFVLYFFYSRFFFFNQNHGQAHVSLSDLYPLLLCKPIYDWVFACPRWGGGAIRGSGDREGNQSGPLVRRSVNTSRKVQKRVF